MAKAHHLRRSAEPFVAANDGPFDDFRTPALVIRLASSLHTFEPTNGGSLNRREFTIETARLILGGAVITLGGCDRATEPSPVYVDMTGDISSNHGHAATITAAAFRRGDGFELDIRGTAGHSHVVSLSAGELATIRVGGRVVKETSGTRHTHVVTFHG